MKEPQEGTWIDAERVAKRSQVKSEMQEFEQVRRWEPIEYDEMPGDMVLSEKYDALLAYTKELAAARASEGGWIDCKQELPPGTTFYQKNRRDYVLAIDAKGRMSIAYVYLSTGSGTPMWTMAKPIGPVTHWKPLPSPPLSVETPNEVSK